MISRELNFRPHCPRGARGAQTSGLNPRIFNCKMELKGLSKSTEIQILNFLF